MPTALSIVLSLFGLFLIQLLLNLRRVARDVGNLPGTFYLFSMSSAPGHFIARIARPVRYLNPGAKWTLGKKYEEFAAAGQDAISLVCALPQPNCVICLADATAIKEVTTSRANFPKPLNLYVALSVFGKNIVASEE